jgi:hypothetical protein
VVVPVTALLEYATLTADRQETKQKAEYWYADVSDNDNEYSSSNNNTRQQQQRGKEGG